MAKVGSKEQQLRALRSRKRQSAKEVMPTAGPKSLSVETGATDPSASGQPAQHRLVPRWVRVIPAAARPSSPLTVARACDTNGLHG